MANSTLNGCRGESSDIKRKMIQSENKNGVEEWERRSGRLEEVSPSPTDPDVSGMRSMKGKSEGMLVLLHPSFFNLWNFIRCLMSASPAQHPMLVLLMQHQHHHLTCSIQEELHQKRTFLLSEL